MALMKNWTMYGGKFGTVILPTLLPLESQDLTYGFREDIDGHDGSVDPDFGAVLGMDSMIRFRTEYLVTALGLIGIDGYPLVTGASANPAIFYFRPLLVGGVPTFTGALSRTVNTGLVVPVTLGGEWNQVSMLDYEITATGDGTNPPIKTAASATPPAANTFPTPQEKFVCGPLLINSALAQIARCRIDFQYEVYRQGHSALPYWTGCGILARRPMLRFSTRDHMLANSLCASLTAPALPVTGFTWNLISMPEGGTRVASNDETGYVTIAGTAGMAAVVTESARNKEKGMLDVTLPIISDGTNPILVITAGGPEILAPA